MYETERRPIFLPDSTKTTRPELRGGISAASLLVLY